ncbi:uncharacterized protein LOC108733884 isoform X2 [Agrilus planipennis]|uniref:Uncharacterized protein LOC108733884 isoform X2 n=1 Tax=Agrilus planipennis TaxID=224129 RepID=A0A1W4W9M1_AGRPL|nr:uncharacterized protein LOC108733884 isoform X2 [Agrilus planipennis]
MKSNYFIFEIIFVLISSIIPWPGPTVFKISCPRQDANIVRKIIQSKWVPVLEKYKAAKHQHRPSQWTCGLCGKSFYEERFLDMHFDNRHKSHINMAEDAVCLADFCDIIRCDVLRSQDIKMGYSEPINTDIELWRESTAYKTELAPTGQRDLAKYVTIKTLPASKSSKRKNLKHSLCQSKEGTQEYPDDNSGRGKEKSQNNSANNDVCPSDLVDSALPATENKQQRIAELQKLKAHCKPEELQKLKNKCEIFVRDCIASLLIHLSVKDFREVEDELNRAICWYLTCDRYWEDSQSDIKQFPWGLWFVIFMVLSLGISLCYYIVWVLFDTDDLSVTSASITDRSTPSPTHLFKQEPSMSSDGSHIYTEDYFTADKDNEYIYVTYPPDLKRRLMESCYNRTTRL